MVSARPFYYLENFSSALGWLQQRYADLLDDAEQSFIARFQSLPALSAALLVRMIGRKGDLFYATKLHYLEIGCPVAAAAALVEAGWLASEPHPQLDWCPQIPQVTFHLRIRSLCERLRLLFFGDFEQDWSQFVLTDLGIFKYEKVPVDARTRAFRRREHLDTFCALLACRQQLEEGVDPGIALHGLPPRVEDNEWLEARRVKLQFRIARACERLRDFERALEIYRACPHPGSRLRFVRMLERLERTTEALQAASDIREQPADEVESQQVDRMWPRLRRKVAPRSNVVPTVAGNGSAGTGVEPAGVGSRPAGADTRPRLRSEWLTFQLVLPVSERPAHLELATGAALAEPDGPVHYVENGLINSLFGLLCWEAIFAPVAGAFFHEFQAAPADLHAPEFYARRAAVFAECLAQLDSDAYRTTIRHNFECKAGIQSPFVFWGVLSQTLLDEALECLPAEHLRVCFERILANVRTNSAGLPDLVQFWPQQRRYRLIEVKGPGDRLQDNQTRWLRFCAARGIPVSVCLVSW